MKYDTPLKFLALILGFALWAYLGYMGKTDLNAMIDLLKVGLGALIYHMIGEQTPATPEPVPAPTAEPKQMPLFVPGQPNGVPVKEGGWIGLALLITIAVIAIGCVIGALEGCAAVPQTIVDVKKVSDDNEVTNIKLGLCNLAVGSVMRHPELQAFVADICRP